MKTLKVNRMYTFKEGKGWVKNECNSGQEKIQRRRNYKRVEVYNIKQIVEKTNQVYVS